MPPMGVAATGDTGVTTVGRIETMRERLAAVGRKGMKEEDDVLYVEKNKKLSKKLEPKNKYIQIRTQAP